MTTAIKSAATIVSGGKLPESGPAGFATGGAAREIDGFEATLTVSVELALPFGARVTCAGLKLQLRPEASPPQARLTCPVKPPEEATLTAKLPELLTEIAALEGETDPLSPPTAICTSWV